MSILPWDTVGESGSTRPHRDASGGSGPLYVVCSPNRCLGKTLLARLLAEFYVAHDRPIAAFDLADESPQLADYLADLTTIVDLSSIRGQVAFFDRLIGEKDTAKVIDVSHRTFRDFFVIANKIGLFEEASRRGIEPLILFLIDPDPKSAPAYSILRRWFADVSLMPVRNQYVASRIPHGRAFSNESPIHVSLEIPILSVRSLVDRPPFSFVGFLQAQSTGLPARVDDELRGFLKRVFWQFCEIEFRRMCGGAGRRWSSDPFG